MWHSKPVIFLTLLWPIAHMVVYVIRFQKLSLDIVFDSHVFIPFGLLSAFLLLKLLAHTKSDIGKKLVVAGYIVGMPFAFIGSLIGGLVLLPLIGATIFGLVPLLIGMGAGYLLGLIFQPKRTSKPQ